MPIVNPEIQSYFASLYSRIGEAKHVPFKKVSVAEWQPKLAECHKNVEDWIDRHRECGRARGWLTWGKDECGGCIFIAHSVVDDNGILCDVTRVDPNTPPMKFLRHIGLEEEFDAMQSEWSWTSYPFVLILPSDSAELGDDIEL